MSVELFIARHGQNEDNVNGILNGHRDLPLTEAGRNQARMLGEGIKDLNIVFSAVYSSPLSRSVETAKIACEVANIKADIQILSDLIERDFGVMTGKNISDIEELCAPDIIKADQITYFLSPEGAETFPVLLDRGKRVFNEILNKEAKGNVLVVCHGDLGKMIYAAATGRSWQDVLTSFHFGNGELINISDNDQAHVIKLDQHNA